MAKILGGSQSGEKTFGKKLFSPSDSQSNASRQPKAFGMKTWEELKFEIRLCKKKLLCHHCIGLSLI